MEVISESFMFFAPTSCQKALQDEMAFMMVRQEVMSDRIKVFFRDPGDDVTVDL